MRLILPLFVLLASSACAQESLQEQIRAIAADAQGKVSMACSLPGSHLDGDLDPHARPPMQSVFKLPLAMAVLHQVEAGKFALDQPIRFAPGDRFVPHAYSPLQDQYPNAGVNVPLRDLLRRAVSQSDNVAADILLREAGGTGAVDDYIKALGVTGFHLVDNEHAQHRDESRQYRNWFEPAGAVQLLRRINDNSPLSADHTHLLLGWMRSVTITQRLSGALPKAANVAHKTGSSGMVNGLAAATNDIGLITLPDGRQLAIAVFVTDSRAPDDQRDQVIARISRAVYDAAVQPNSNR
jgi:beta-lactamase class A